MITVEEHTGLGLIARERARQNTVEGFDAQHDTKHPDGQLAVAAACYAAFGTEAEVIRRHGENDTKDAWPWVEEWDKRQKHPRLKQLAIAGALIAAEIDRITAVN